MAEPGELRGTAERWRESDGLVPLGALTRGRAAALLAACAALVFAALIAVLTPPSAAPAAGRPGSDARLYAALIDDVAHGVPYYTAAPRELRRDGFPLRPFMAVRPPALAVALAALPDTAARRAALGVLALGVWAAWAWRLRGAGVRPLRYVWALVLAGSGAAVALAGQAYLFHESWAGLLIALSLALRRRDAWAASLVVGFVAAVVREFALPYLAVMALFAGFEGRGKEAAGWAAALGLALAALAAHAVAATAAASPADLGSPGWMGLGGLGFVLRLTHVSPLTISFPLLAQAFVLPAALLGLVLWRAPEPGLGRRTAFLVLGFLAGFLVVGRADNDYWGFLIAPLWPLGLLEVDRAALALISRLGPVAAAAAPVTAET